MAKTFARGSMMLVVIYTAFTVGLTLFIGLIAYQGLDQMIAALAMTGWGLMVVVLFHLLPIAINTLGWRVLFERDERPFYAQLFKVRWIGEAVNALLPVAQVGGEVVKARLMMRHDCGGALAGASVIVDLTVGLFAQLAFTLLGLLLLAYSFSDGMDVWWLLTGMIVALLLFGGFYAAQRRGLFSRLAHVLERLGSANTWAGIAGDAKAMDSAMNVMYRDKASIFACGMWRLLGWMAGTGEIWLALYFMGHTIEIRDALLLESLGQAVRAAAFFVPGAIGVQEGGFMLLGGVLGLGAETALALSLMKRVREIGLGLPALVVWQFYGGRGLWSRQDETP